VEQDREQRLYYSYTVAMNTDTDITVAVVTLVTTETDFEIVSTSAGPTWNRG